MPNRPPRGTVRTRTFRASVLCAVLASMACSGVFASRRSAAKVSADEGAVSRQPRRTRATAATVLPPRAPNPAEPPDAEPEPIASDSAGVARLIRLAHVWHTVALHHPWVATRGVPWDSALIVAATRVRSATDDAALTTAYARLFANLGDPLTRVEPAVMANPASVAVTTERTGDSIVVIHIAPSAPLDAADSVLVVTTIGRLPTRVVLDLRGAPVTDPLARAVQLEHFLARTGLTDQLLRGTVAAPAERTRRIGVWAPVDDGRGARVFHDGWQQGIEPTYVGHATGSPRIIMLADSGTVLPGVLLALHDAAGATLVADGALRDAAPVQRVRIPISPALVASVRVGELVHGDGSVDVTPDTTVIGASSSDGAMAVAMTVLRATAPLPLAERPLPMLVAPAATPVFYDTTAYPFMGARLLAGFRLWSAMRARHAYRDLYDDDLDAVFERVIPRLEAARSAEDYAKSIAELAASLDDAEGVVKGASYDAVVGTAALPFRLRYAEGRVFLSDIVRDSVTTTLGLVPGTEIVALDGFPTVAWLSEHRRVAPATNDWTRTRLLMQQMSRGRPGDAMVRVRDVNNRERTLSVPRRISYRDALPTTERPLGAPVRLVGEGVGYLDVERLTDATVDSAFATLHSARGVVLDLRGHLTIDDMRLLRHLAAKTRAVVGRAVQRSLASPCQSAIREAVLECPDVRESQSWWRTVDTSALFTGRIVALIDERTQGAMERFALSLEQLTAVTFIGSASAGALSWTTPLSLPGGLTVGIATQEIRRADGGQVQRVGLNPVVDVRPTARGVRAGDDEVLSRAQQWLQQQLEPPRRRR
ncbi:MAG: hypothetical protein IPP90_22220 [Gemmatimonadaceae bacterium]|nr:hypothetical protein [Gemmatimonadaceae bacterium]